ncbi:NifX-associated nitrogen fixation protein [Sorangium sp. So ce1024]|uniref:NifX-associated nitrogen fixation protein n=1 Tax=unclassified Sorangium TaxID=2621164 RepID=UPI003F05AE12
MDIENQSSTPSDEAAVRESPFLKTLVGLIRAEDSYGAWDRKRDADLLAEFVVTKEARRGIPIVGDPGPDVLHRVEQFYRAVGLRIEQQTGLMASPMMTMSHEGFGRVILTTGRLVAFAKSLRDVHRFGFDSLEVLSREGEKAVARAVEAISTYPEVARA